MMIPDAGDDSRTDMTCARSWPCSEGKKKMQEASSSETMTGEAKGSLLLFNHYASTPDMADGTRHYDIGKALAARGYDVTVIASACAGLRHGSGRCRNGEEYVVENFLEAPGLRFVWIRTAEEGVGLVSRAISMFSYLPRATAVARKLLSLIHI